MKNFPKFLVMFWPRQKMSPFFRRDLCAWWCMPAVCILSGLKFVSRKFAQVSTSDFVLLRSLTKYFLKITEKWSIFAWKSEHYNKISFARYSYSLSPRNLILVSGVRESVCPWKFLPVYVFCIEVENPGPPRHLSQAVNDRLAMVKST